MTHPKTSIPFVATHPGTLIKDELDMIPDMKQKDLAKELDVRTSFLSEVINGKRPVTPKLALKLEKALGISAEYWNNLQAQYNLDMMRIEDRDYEANSQVAMQEHCKEEDSFTSKIKDRLDQILKDKGLDYAVLAAMTGKSKDEVEAIIAQLCKANRDFETIERALGESVVKITLIAQEVKYKTVVVGQTALNFQKKSNYDRINSSGFLTVNETKGQYDFVSDLN